MVKIVQNNLSTIIVSVLLVISIIWALKSIAKNQKRGCSFGCTGCSGSCSAFNYTKQAIRQHNEAKRKQRKNLYFLTSFKHDNFWGFTITAIFNNKDKS